MTHRFKPGDKIIRCPKYAKHWTSPVVTVKELVYFHDGSPAIILEESFDHGITKYDPDFFELEHVYNSPLYKALL